MELKVWVEGIQRIVCGVTDSTTCHDVVFALAHATGKSGRFILLERWRNNERQLAPNENPLKILMKWGEYSNDVQFILQWSETKKNQLLPHTRSKSTPTSPTTSPPVNITVDLKQKSASEIQKSLTFSGSHISSDNVGVVRGVPHARNGPSLEVRESPHQSPKKSSYCGSETSDSSSQRIAPPYKDPPAPPPYRDPPPPKRNHPDNNKRDDIRNRGPDTVIYSAHYRELISLINYQREKLSNQQTDLNKFDAEIVFWECKEREKHMQLEYIAQEIIAVTNATKLNQEQIQALNYIDEENELVKQQEKTLKSEMTLLRSKLANCETELLQCKNKIRLLMDEVQIEQRAQYRRIESRKQIERNFMIEVDRLQRDIEIAKQSTELHHFTSDTLKRDVAALESAIMEKKKQVELLVNEMKAANLQSLTIAPPDDLKAIIEGPNKSGGSTRRMIGSPRQLENAVPTNKNPHGVWV